MGCMLRQTHVLLVENDPQVREALVSVLSSENYQVASAASCDEAVLQYQDNPADVVLLDLSLQAEDGWDVFQALKQLDPNLPIIVISARADCLADVSAAGASGALEKPFDITALLSLLNQAVANKNSGRTRVTQLALAAAVLFCACFPFAALAQSPNITTPFQITGVRVLNGNSIVTWQGGGASNQLQHATSLSGPWQSLGRPSIASSATNPLSGPLCFFRIMAIGSPGPPIATLTPSHPSAARYN